MTEKRLLDSRETAATLGISLSFLYNLHRRRELRGLKVGKLRMYLPEEVDAYVQRLKAARDGQNAGAVTWEDYPHAT